MAGLRRRFVLAGILNLLLCPFIMTLMLFYFLLKHAEEIHGHRAKVRRGRQTRGPSVVW